MNDEKSDRNNDEIWAQHLRWLSLISNECQTNQAKRERERERQASHKPRCASGAAPG